MIFIWHSQNWSYFHIQIDLICTFLYWSSLHFLIMILICTFSNWSSFHFLKIDLLGFQLSPCCSSPSSWPCTSTRPRGWGSALGEDILLAARCFALPLLDQWSWLSGNNYWDILMGICFGGGYPACCQVLCLGFDNLTTTILTIIIILVLWWGGYPAWLY